MIQRYSLRRANLHQEMRLSMADESGRERFVGIVKGAVMSGRSFPCAGLQHRVSSKKIYIGVNPDVQMFLRAAQAPNFFFFFFLFQGILANVARVCGINWPVKGLVNTIPETYGQRG